MTRTFSSKGYRPLFGIIKRNTDKALLLVLEDTEALTEEDAKLKVWLPKSQISNITPTKDQQGNSIVMASAWIISQKSLGMYSIQAANRINNLPKAPVVPIKSSPPIPTTPPVRPHCEVMDDLEDDISF